MLSSLKCGLFAKRGSLRLLSLVANRCALESNEDALSSRISVALQLRALCVCAFQILR